MKLHILDRDGTINQAGWTLVATNSSRGRLTDSLASADFPEGARAHATLADLAEYLMSNHP